MNSLQCVKKENTTLHIFTSPMSALHLFYEHGERVVMMFVLTTKCAVLIKPEMIVSHLVYL